MRIIVQRSIRVSLVFVTIAFSTAHGQDSTIYLETFDAVDAPDMPYGWQTDASIGWSTSLSVASPGSGGNNALVQGADSTSLEGPIIDFSDVTSGSFSYSARRTSTFDSTGIVVEASLDAGFSYPIVLVASGTALPGAASSYEYITTPLPDTVLGAAGVRIRFRAFGSTGGNARIDDVAIVGTGSASTNQAGFAAATSSTVSGTDSLGIAFSLNVIPGIGELHGLQVDLSWPATDSILTVEPGSSIDDPVQWDLAHETSQNPGRIVLLSKTSTGLSPGLYDTLFTIWTNVSALDSAEARSDTLTVSALIGSRSEVTGDDATITAGILRHVISIEQPRPSFAVSTDTVFFGVVDADSIATNSFFVSNPDGNVDLLVQSIASDNAAITVTPESFVIGIGDSIESTISIDASQLPAGPFFGTLEINHIAESSPDTVFVVGRIGQLSERGDVNDDGFTDLVDLVLAIDHVVGSVLLPQELSDRLDLYPFPTGDGSEDVRDLTVLVHAINSGLWPDDVPVAGNVVTSKLNDELVGTLLIRKIDGGGVGISVEYAPGLRAVRLILTADTGLDVRSIGVSNLGVMTRTHVAEYLAGRGGEISVLGYALEGLLGGNGEQAPMPLVVLRSGGEVEEISVLKAEAVDSFGQRVILEEQLSDLPANPAKLALLSPYPQPFSHAKHTTISIPVEVEALQLVDIEITDILGRAIARQHRIKAGTSEPVSWGGRTDAGVAVPPGVYFVNVSGDGTRQSVPVVITR